MSNILVQPRRTGRLAYLGATLLLALAAIVALVATSRAQTPSTPKPLEQRAALPEGARLLGIEEFRKKFIGKTVTFQLPDGSPWGKEYYDPNGVVTIFVHNNGECLIGAWARRGDFDCFDYEQGASCWLTYEIGGKLEVLSSDNHRQLITSVVDNDPLTCKPELIGRGAGPNYTPVLYRNITGAQK